MNTKIKYVFLFVLCASILAACSTPASTAIPANPTGVPATKPTVGSAASSNFPTGKFIKSGTMNYGFIFNEDGTYSRFEGNVTATRGTYSVDGNIFTETSNDGGCASNISHMFTFDGKDLTFNYVANPQDDTCGGGGRRADFDNVTYTLSEEANFPSGKFIKAGTTNYGLLFNADGTFSAFDGNRTIVQATYTVEGNVFTETSNSGGCKTNESFTYLFDGTSLTFNYVGNPDDDTSCDGRHAAFNNVTYTLSEQANFPSGKFIKAGTTNYGLLFNADGTFSVFEGDSTFVRATYVVEGNVFTETSNTGGCKTNESFTYIFDGTSLTFNYVGNPDADSACAGRHADFNNVAYILTGK